MDVATLLLQNATAATTDFVIDRLILCPHGADDLVSGSYDKERDYFQDSKIKANDAVVADATIVAFEFKE